MSFYEEIKENLMSQINELEALQSVYPKELVISDHGTLADINSFIECPEDELPQKLEYSIEISTDEGPVELLVSLSYEYPKKAPEVYARSSLLDRTQQLLMNETLTLYANDQDKGEPCIYALISWIQDNAGQYIKSSKISEDEKHRNKAKKETEQSDELIFARYWIYSHHIYSKFKRQDILDLAKDNCLTGFCLAGKPGVICIEGNINDCDYCWQKIKSMNWQKILLKLVEKESVNDNDKLQKMRQYTDFQEISFPTSKKHNDLGELLKYLKQHKAQHVFKELFGLEGKSVPE